MFQFIARQVRIPRITNIYWILRRKWRNFALAYNAVLLKSQGVEIGKNIILFGMPIIHRIENSRIIIGERCQLVSSNAHSTLGINHPVFIRTVRPGAIITIGDDAGISGGTFVASLSISIGKNVLIGPNVEIVDSDFHTIKAENRRYSQDENEIHSAPIVIEDNVFIGAEAMILKGVTIGYGAIVGAGSVVVQDVPRNSIVAGNPARLVREIAV